MSVFSKEFRLNLKKAHIKVNPLYSLNFRAENKDKFSGETYDGEYRIVDNVKLLEGKIKW